MFAELNFRDTKCLTVSLFFSNLHYLALYFYVRKWFCVVSLLLLFAWLKQIKQTITYCTNFLHIYNLQITLTREALTQY